MELQELLSEPETWIIVTFLLFVGGVFKTVKKLLFKVLDERSAKIDAELKQAQSLREEAEKVLALYKKKQAEYTKEAAEILSKAREDAEQMVKQADKDLQGALDARMEHALNEIAQEEARAINDIRSHIVDISLAAARTVVKQHIETVPQQDLLKLALADIDRKIH